MAGWCTKIEGNTIPLSVPYTPGAKYLAYTLREPVGVRRSLYPGKLLDLDAEDVDALLEGGLHGAPRKGRRVCTIPSAMASSVCSLTAPPSGTPFAAPKVYTMRPTGSPFTSTVKVSGASGWML